MPYSYSILFVEQNAPQNGAKYSKSSVKHVNNNSLQKLSLRASIRHMGLIDVKLLNMQINILSTLILSVLH